MGDTTAVARKTRSSRGRQRIEIKKMEDESKRQVTFSKRRKGLFNKAKELSTLCATEIGILNISKSGRFFTTDNIDWVLDRFLRDSSDCNDSLLVKNEVEEHDLNFGFWLDQPMEDLDLVELEECATVLKELRDNAAARLEELSIQNSTRLWPWVADQEVNMAEVEYLFMAEETYDCCRNSVDASLVGHHPDLISA